jgi:hypothetical protein
VSGTSLSQTKGSTNSLVNVQGLRLTKRKANDVTAGIRAGKVSDEVRTGGLNGKFSSHGYEEVYGVEIVGSRLSLSFIYQQRGTNAE